MSRKISSTNRTNSTNRNNRTHTTQAQDATMSNPTITHDLFVSGYSNGYRGYTHVGSGSMAGCRRKAIELGPKAIVTALNNTRYEKVPRSKTLFLTPDEAKQGHPMLAVRRSKRTNGRAQTRQPSQAVTPAQMMHLLDRFTADEVKLILQVMAGQQAASAPSQPAVEEMSGPPAGDADAEDSANLAEAMAQIVTRQAGRCQAITQAGSQCKNKVVDGERFCTVHKIIHDRQQ